MRPSKNIESNSKHEKKSLLFELFYMLQRSKIVKKYVEELFSNSNMTILKCIQLVVRSACHTLCLHVALIQRNTRQRNSGFDFISSFSWLLFHYVACKNICNESCQMLQTKNMTCCNLEINTNQLGRSNRNRYETLRL